jgi:hypothetical protein
MAKPTSAQTLLTTDTTINGQQNFAYFITGVPRFNVKTDINVENNHSYGELDIIHNDILMQMMDSLGRGSFLWLDYNADKPHFQLNTNYGGAYANISADPTVLIIEQNQGNVRINGMIMKGKMTAAVANSTPSEDGTLVYITVTDATFTQIGFWAKENGAWKKL